VPISFGFPQENSSRRLVMVGIIWGLTPAPSHPMALQSSAGIIPWEIIMQKSVGGVETRFLGWGGRGGGGVICIPRQSGAPFWRRFARRGKDLLLVLWKQDGIRMAFLPGEISRGVTGLPNAALDRPWAMTNKWSAHRGFITSCGFSPDGHSILSSSNDKTLRLWNFQGECIKIFKVETPFPPHHESTRLHRHFSLWCRWVSRRSSSAPIPFLSPPTSPQSHYLPNQWM
jgi:hypothetical protein